MSRFGNSIQLIGSYLSIRAISQSKPHHQTHLHAFPARTFKLSKTTLNKPHLIRCMYYLMSGIHYLMLSMLQNLAHGQGCEARVTVQLLVNSFWSPDSVGGATS